MKRLQAVSRECQQKNTIVTYDLARAKIAKQIQSEDFPKFDEVFMFGVFHIALNILSSIGKIIEVSGGPSVLLQAKIVAPGSINQFLKEKMYNRCKRGHRLLGTAFHGLHLDKFIEDMTDKDNLICDLKNIAIQGPVNVQNIPQKIKEVFDEYEKFVNETLAGKRKNSSVLDAVYYHYRP